MNEPEKIYNDLLLFYGRITFLTILIPVFVAVWKYKFLNKILKLFLFYLILTFVFGLIEQLFVWVASNTKLLNNLIKAFNIGDTNFYQVVYYLKNFLVLGWIYALLLENYASTIWLKRVTAFLIVSVVFNYFFGEGYNVYGVYNPTVDSIFCLLLPLFFLWFVYTDIRSKVHINKNSYFWISLGLAIPNLVSLILFLVGKKLYATNFVLFCQISLGRDVISVIGFILVSVGFYYARFTKYLPQHQ